MSKTTQTQAGRFTRTALIAIGWIAFLMSFITHKPLVILLFRAIARVLP